MCRRRPLGFGVAVKSSKRKQGELEISGAVAVLRSVPLGWPPGHLVGIVLEHQQRAMSTPLGAQGFVISG